MIRVLIADSHPAVRLALRAWLRQYRDFTVVGEAADIETLRALIAGGAPQLVLLDWGLPGSDAPQIIAALHAQYPQLCIVALSGRPENRPAALQAGAHAFVSKADPPEALLQAMTPR